MKWTRFRDSSIQLTEISPFAEIVADDLIFKNIDELDEFISALMRVSVKVKKDRGVHQLSGDILK